MRIILNWIAIGLVLQHAVCARGVIHHFKELTINFTSAVSATNEATWSATETFNVTAEGLGWDGATNSQHDGWIQTTPLALGLSWRTPYGVVVRVMIQPPAREVVSNDGQKTTPHGGNVFVRYSPDRKHWSSWQVLQESEAQSPKEKETHGRFFKATVLVPEVERVRYRRLMSEYSTLTDVPWKNDEEAIVRWILSREPDFFEKQLPFIGYVQFRFEAQFHGGQRIRSLRAEVSYVMSGMYVEPKDEDSIQRARETLRDPIPWRFEAK